MSSRRHSYLGSLNSPVCYFLVCILCSRVLGRISHCTNTENTFLTFTSGTCKLQLTYLNTVHCNKINKNVKEETIM